MTSGNKMAVKHISTRDWETLNLRYSLHVHTIWNDKNIKNKWKILIKTKRKIFIHVSLIKKKTTKTD